MLDCSRRGRICNDCCAGTDCNPCSGQPCLDPECITCPDPGLDQDDCASCNHGCTNFVSACIWGCLFK
jgi:hypothetical protein